MDPGRGPPALTRATLCPVPRPPRHRRPLPALGVPLLLLIVVSSIACVSARVAPRSSARTTRVAPPADRGPTPTILSADFSRVDDPELGGLDGILLVFSVEVDAAALDPRAFVVSRANAGPVRPRRALLSPASEDDENRSVMLVGEFGDTSEDHQPTHVAVTGPLFAEDGTRLTGLGATVVPFGGPPRIVAAAILAAGPGRCEGATRLLRTYWSDELRGVEPEDRERIRMQAEDGTSTHPSSFDDHEADHAEAGQDNVLDLCLAQTTWIDRIWVEAGVFRDVSGHGSAAVELQIDDPKS